MKKEVWNLEAHTLRARQGSEVASEHTFAALPIGECAVVRSLRYVTLPCPECFGARISVLVSGNSDIIRS